MRAITARGTSGEKHMMTFRSRTSANEIRLGDREVLGENPAFLVPAGTPGEAPEVGGDVLAGAFDALAENACQLLELVIAELEPQPTGHDPPKALEVGSLERGRHRA